MLGRSVQAVLNASVGLCFAPHSMRLSYLFRSLVDEEHSISLISSVTSGTGIPEPGGSGFMAERTLAYFTHFLFF